MKLRPIFLRALSERDRGQSSRLANRTCCQPALSVGELTSKLPFASGCFSLSAIHYSGEMLPYQDRP
jgi:hypothetical protein